jgi:hypothetical protein
MNDLPNITDSKKVWLVFANTDNTEGRGKEYIKHVTEIEATAVRLGRKGYVQGGNCPIVRGHAVKINGTWFIPVEIVSPTKDDISAQKRITIRREAYEKAVAAGMSDDDIKALGFRHD